MSINCICLDLKLYVQWLWHKSDVILNIKDLYNILFSITFRFKCIQ